MSILKYWNGSSWVLVPDGTAFKYWNGSSYVNPNAVRYWNGSWIEAWTKSDPITLRYYPTMTTNMRWDGSEVDYDSNLSASNDALASLGLGRYNGEKPYHYTSILKFDGSADTGHASLYAQLNARPVVKSVKIRLYRELGVGLNSPAGLIRFGTWSQLNAHTLPATTLNGTYHDWGSAASYDISGWIRGTTREFTLNAQHVYDLNAGKSLMLSEVTSGYLTSGGTTNAHSQIGGLNKASLAERPYLTITFDLV